MKRNLIYIFLLAALAIAAYFFVIKKPWGTLNVDETAFAVADTGSIGKIFIADMQGQKILLERSKDGWIVNQQYSVRVDYIDKLLSTIKNVAVSYPVAASAQSTVVKEMASHNKKVEIYDRGGKKIKAYYVGNPSLDQLGTYMLIEGAEKPYVTAIPGFQGTLESRYTTDESTVRSGKIYNYRINDLKSVSVTYPAQPDSSFIIEVLGADSFQLENYLNAPLTKFNKQRVQQYLDYYKFVNCEAFVNDLTKKDTILQTQPICTITVTDRSNQSHAMVIYNMPRTQDSAQQFDRKGNPVLYDTDHFFATINNGKDFVIVQQFHLGRLFKKNLLLSRRDKTREVMQELMQTFGESNVLYVLFGLVILVFLILELGILVRRKTKMTVRSALIQTICWVCVALGYGYVIYVYHGKEEGLQYISAYLMEYSLSADNLFVFIIILSYFKISEKYYQKVLFYGIIGAVILRVIFILLGIVIVEQFHWILYLFGAILIYTGFQMLLAGGENQFNPEKNIMYKLVRRNLRLMKNEANGNFTIMRNGKRYFSILFLVVAIIASTDLVFALDSIPAVFAISQDRLVIITSNVFAVMGLRAMFYLLSHMANKFDYLQEGISIVLIFIGVKMLIEIVGIHIPTGWSLVVIASVLTIAILVSIFRDKPASK